MNAPEIDETLWFRMGLDCEDRHYMVGNPHTFPGRMLGWCPTKQRRFFFSLASVTDASPEARAWIAGFLAGNEPAPPLNAGGDVDFASEEYARWTERVREFHRTGRWKTPGASDDGESAEESTEAATWTVWRQDDNANQFAISSGHAREHASRICKSFELRGHKQTYWIAPDTDGRPGS